jgi:T5SS/PEP-CTERM-associated repeat protein/uncharacterized repeat protein (TIGR03803 family)
MNKRGTFGERITGSGKPGIVTEKRGKTMEILHVPLVVVLLVLAGRALNANAQTESNLYSLGSSPTDGVHPEAGLVQGSDGNFYGTTFLGGTNNDGTVYRVSPSGTETTLYSFVGSPTDGGLPWAGLVQGSDGNFYGTTVQGGTSTNCGGSGCGTVFRISPSGTKTTLYSFVGYPGDGGSPYAGLVQGSDGNFYGTTSTGGRSTNCGGGCGTVFRISPSGTETTLYSFVGYPGDGGSPYAGLVQGSDSNFYGTTFLGGTADGGTVFRVSPNGNYTNLHSFIGYPTDGGLPWAGLVQGSDGNFYGTTENGGPSTNLDAETGDTGYGTVFRISPSGTYTSLYFFGSTSTDGAYPRDGLVQGSDGNFYGTTEQGGTSTNCQYGCGTMFRISPSGNYTSLYSFVGSPTDGAYPRDELVQGSDGNFYGTTDYGGTGPNCGSGCGTVFRFTVPLSMTATANSWVAGNGKWETGGNWSLGVPPSVVDPADLITNATSKTVTIDAVTAGFPSTLTISNLTVSAPLGSASTLLLNNAGTTTPLSILNALTIDTNGALVVNQSAVQVGNNLLIGVSGGTSALSITNGGTVYNGIGYIGYNSSSSSNTVLVSGTGSIWTNTSDLEVGYNGAGNGLIISNGGAVYNGYGNIGLNSTTSSNNLVLVSGNGSVWNNRNEVNVGVSGAGNELIISNGGGVYDVNGLLGYNASGSNNLVLVSGNGSVWNNRGTLWVGNDSTGNSLAVSNQGTVFGNGIYVGVLPGSQGTLTLAGGSITASYILSVGFQGTGTVWMTGGSLLATNLGLAVGDNPGTGQMTISNGTVQASSLKVGIWPGAIGTMTIAGGSVTTLSDFEVGYYAGSIGTVWMTGGQLMATDLMQVGPGGTGQMTLSNGTVTAGELVLTNGTNSAFTFDGGLLNSGGTFVTNNQVFVVGDGSDAATFQLNGGVHSFANNLEITSNAFLTGCGTIEGNVTVDPGGTVLANCGGTLTFSDVVTNNGTMQAVNGSVLQAYGPVVNNGFIIATNGTAQFLGGLVNNGCVFTQADLQISSIALMSAPLISNLVVVIKIPSVTCATYQLQVTPSLKPATWTNLNASQSGSGSVLTFFDFNGATNRPGRFYRIDITLP